MQRLGIEALAQRVVRLGEQNAASPAGQGRGRSSSASMVRRLCVIVFRKRPRRKGTITRIGPSALVSTDSRRRVAAPPCSGMSSACWLSRKEPNAPVEAGQATNLILCLAMDSLRTGKRLRWNASARKVEG